MAYEQDGLTFFFTPRRGVGPEAGTALVFRGFVHHFVAGRNLKHCSVGFSAIDLRDGHRLLTSARVAVFHEHIYVQIVGVSIFVGDGDCLSGPAEGCRHRSGFADAVHRQVVHHLGTEIFLLDERITGGRARCRRGE